MVLNEKSWLTLLLSKSDHSMIVYVFYCWAKSLKLLFQELFINFKKGFENNLCPY